MSRQDARNGPSGAFEAKSEPRRLSDKAERFADSFLAPNSPGRRAQEWICIIGAIAVILVALVAMLGTLVGNERHERIKVRHEQAAPLDNAAATRPVEESRRAA